MPRRFKDTVAFLGIDIGKNTFHLVGLNKRGAIVLRQKLSRRQLDAVAQGPHRLLLALSDILATRTDLLAPRLLHILIGDWQRLDQRIDTVSLEIRLLAREDPACERLMTVPGIGRIISSATVAAIGTVDVFSKGRDFGACLGLVPKPISTGDRTILGRIFKRGNKYLRTLFVGCPRRAAEARHLGAPWPVAVDCGAQPSASTTTCWRSRAASALLSVCVGADHLAVLVFGGS
jgi:transposase